MSFMQAVDQRIEQALASGDLQPIQYYAQPVHAKNLDFRVCWIPALSLKQTNTPVGFLGRPVDPDFNPFLPPDPNLTIGKLGDYHHAILNKFPVCERHLVIPRIAFADQRSVLQYEDFLALSLVLSEYAGLGFYNGGPEAGASQRHLHLQWLPEAASNPSLLPFIRGLDKDIEQQVQQQSSWGFDHAFVYVPSTEEAHEYARGMYQAYQLACKKLAFAPDENGLMPPMNMLVQDGWLLLVPRTQERCDEIILNALSFAGMIYVREQEHIDWVKEKGVLQLLASVTS